MSNAPQAGALEASSTYAFQRLAFLGRVGLREADVNGQQSAGGSNLHPPGLGHPNPNTTPVKSKHHGDQSGYVNPELTQASAMGHGQMLAVTEFSKHYLRELDRAPDERKGAEIMKDFVEFYGPSKCVHHSLRHDLRLNRAA